MRVALKPKTHKSFDASLGLFQCIYRPLEYDFQPVWHCDECPNDPGIGSMTKKPKENISDGTKFARSSGDFSKESTR